jgi:hypothetical protein
VETIGFDYGQRQRWSSTCGRGCGTARALRSDWAARLGEDHLIARCAAAISKPRSHAM